MRGVLKPREERIAQDAYFTPAPLADAICERLADLLPPQACVWDPCCGELAFVNAALETWPSAPSVVGTDLSAGADFLTGPPGLIGATLIVSNPPYLLAEPFVHRALALVREPEGCLAGGHVAFLLRLSFLGGQGRAERIYSRRNLRWLIPITPRPSFTPDGKTDASEYAVFVWQRGFAGNAELLAPLRWNRAEGNWPTGSGVREATR
jgi:hypothetical protein